MERQLINAFRLFNVMSEEKIAYVYRGCFNTDIIDSILNLTEASINEDKSPNKNKKRAYAVMVEGLQNITRHQDRNENEIQDRKSLFIMQKMQDNYYITTGNTIENPNIAPLKEQIETINRLSSIELKQYYKDVLNNGLVSKKGGAGLGLIDIAKKSKSQLSYCFKPIDQDTSYFYLHTLPPSASIDSRNENSASNPELNKIIETHNTLNDEDLIISFFNLFKLSNLRNFLEFLKINITETTGLKNRGSKIAYIMLKNAILHSCSKSNTSLKEEENNDNFWLFFISKNENEYFITTGNYTPRKNKESIRAFFKALKEIPFGAKATPEDSGLVQLKKQVVSSFVYDIIDINDECIFLSIKAGFKPLKGEENII